MLVQDIYDGGGGITLIHCCHPQPGAWLEKVGNWGRWFPGNFVIWREIYEFETKKYIRNVGKYCNLGGEFYHVPGKSNIFSSHDPGAYKSNP